MPIDSQFCVSRDHIAWAHGRNSRFRFRNDFVLETLVNEYMEYPPTFPDSFGTFMSLTDAQLANLLWFHNAAKYRWGITTPRSAITGKREILAQILGMG